MKKLLILFLLLSGCTSKSDLICDYRFINYCHTQQEWDEISRKNLEALDCMDKEMAQIKNFNAYKDLNQVYQKCNVKVIGEIYN